jgi:hypothetical protein
MARVALTLGVLLLASCADNPYVIGRKLDAGRGDAGVDAGGDSCAVEHPEALVCGGFEGADVETGWSDSATVEQGTLALSTTRVHRGQGALLATSRGPDSAAIVVAELPSLRTGALYLRTYIYIPSGLATETMNLFFIGATPTPDPFIGLDFNLEDGAVQLFSPQASPQRSTGTTTIARDRWVCYRVRVTIAEQRGAVQIHLDDELALDVTNIDTLPPEGIKLFRAGIDWSSSQDTLFQVYLDDLVLSTTPTPCLGDGSR